jgi:hypothetical protein
MMNDKQSVRHSSFSVLTSSCLHILFILSIPVNFFSSTLSCFDVAAPGRGGKAD